MKKILSVVLVLVISFSFCCPSVFAAEVTEEAAWTAPLATQDWEEYYSSYMDDGSAILFQPGSDESERNISWYSPITAGKCTVQVSESEDFATFKTFKTSFVVTESGDRSNKATITGLEPGKTYWYRCVTGKKESNAYSFTTLSSDEFTAMYVTDIHVSREQDGMENSLVHQSYMVDYTVNKALEQSDIDLIISGGDQASYGDRIEYESLVASPALKSIPFALAVGNHDRKGSAYKYFNNNPNKYKLGTSSLIGNDYWYVKGNVLFLVYDSNCTAAETHRSFTKQAIEANPGVKWKVAVMHHDMYGRIEGKRLNDANENRRPVFVPIFDEFGVDLVLLGHSHFWTISNVMYGGEVAQSITDVDSITDAQGTIYAVSASINRPKTVETINAVAISETVGKTYVNDNPMYLLLDFSDGSIEINSYTVNGETPFNTFTINKTDNSGGHPGYEAAKDSVTTRFQFEFIAFFTELFEGIAGIWKTYFDK